MSATTGNPESFNLKLIGIVLVLGMVSAACAAAATDSAEESSVVVAQGESSGSGATGSSADGELPPGHKQKTSHQETPRTLTHRQLFLRQSPSLSGLRLEVAATPRARSWS